MTDKTDNDTADGQREKKLLKKVRDHIRDMEDPEYGVEIDAETIHPSQMGYCRRQQYNMKLGLRETPDWLRKTFRLGTAYHGDIERIVNEFDRQRQDVTETELSVEFTDEADGSLPDLRITGHADVVTPDFVIDWKTQGHNGWSYVTDSPKDHHVDQLMVYLHGLKHIERRERYGLIHYIDKTTGEQATHPVQYDEERARELIERSRDVVSVVAMVLDELDMNDMDHTHDNVVELHERGTVSIPFDKCSDDADCFMCEKESLVFDAGGS